MRNEAANDKRRDVDLWNTKGGPGSGIPLTPVCRANGAKSEEKKRSQFSRGDNWDDLRLRRRKERRNEMTDSPSSLSLSPTTIRQRLGTSIFGTQDKAVSHLFPELAIEQSDARKSGSKDSRLLLLSW